MAIKLLYLLVLLDRGAVILWLDEVENQPRSQGLSSSSSKSTRDPGNEVGREWVISELCLLPLFQNESLCETTFFYL